MTPETCAQIHGQAFAGQSRGWSPQEFEDLLISTGVFLCAGTNSFALGRVIADEAELLTIATAPACQRLGEGRACLQRFEEVALSKGAMTTFLEVGADAIAAQALYHASGYVEIARRNAYYARSIGKVDAIIMSKRLLLGAND